MSNAVNTEQSFVAASMDILEKPRWEWIKTLDRTKEYLWHITCGVCGQRFNQYAHLMYQSSYLWVCRSCAEQLEGNFKRAKSRETYMKRHYDFVQTQRERFLALEWKKLYNGNYVLWHNKTRIIIIHDKKNGYGIYLKSWIYWLWWGKPISNLDTGKRAAFDVYYENRHR